MEHDRYMPKDDAGKNQWLKNFAGKLPTYAAELGLAPEEVTYVQKASVYFDYLQRLILFIEKFKSATVTYKNLMRNGGKHGGGDLPVFAFEPAPEAVPAGIFDYVSGLVARIKHGGKYNEPMGKNLGITGSEVTKDFATVKPEPKAELKNGHPYLSWLKEHSQAAHIKADYNDGNGFREIAQVSHNHYIDPHLPPAGESRVYKYMVRYVFHDEEVGDWSGEVSVTVTGV